MLSLDGKLVFGLQRRVLLTARLLIVVCSAAIFGLAAHAQAEDEALDVAPIARQASSDILQSSDAAATQRLRFDVGDRVFFAPGSAELGSRARTVLSRQAQWLAAWNASVVIVGHADEGGAPENDERVALKRAEVVWERLLEEGIPAENLQIVGLGRENPIADCPEPACGAQNRRVVVHVMTTETGSKLER